MAVIMSKLAHSRAIGPSEPLTIIADASLPLINGTVVSAFDNSYAPRVGYTSESGMDDTWTQTCHSSTAVVQVDATGYSTLVIKVAAPNNRSTNIGKLGWGTTSSSSISAALETISINTGNKEAEFEFNISGQGTIYIYIQNTGWTIDASDYEAPASSFILVQEMYLQ